MHRRRETHAVINATRLHVHGEVAVKHFVLHALIEMAEHFHHTENPTEDLQRQITYRHHRSIDAKAHHRNIGARLDMQIARTGPEACEQQQSIDVDAFCWRVVTGITLALRSVHHSAACIDERNVGLAELLR